MHRLAEQRRARAAAPASAQALGLDRLSVARRFGEPRLVLASHNPGKLAELRSCCAGQASRSISSRGARPAGAGRRPAATFAANARLKAHAAAQATGLPALADDSGLAVRGARRRARACIRRAGPGRSATFGRAMARVRDELSCALWQLRARPIAGRPSSRCSASPGRTATRSWPKAGSRASWSIRRAAHSGFGYDPMFRSRRPGSHLRRAAAAAKQAAQPPRPRAPPAARDAASSSPEPAVGSVRAATSSTNLVGGGSIDARRAAARPRARRAHARSGRPGAAGTARWRRRSPRPW